MATALAFAFMVGMVDAKTKRMDEDLVKTATALAKDREASFSGEEAMADSDFQAQWTQLAEAIDEAYDGHSVKLKTFDTDVRARKAFSHLLFMTLRVAQKVHLQPAPGELVSRHSFLQELTTDGACYTGGDTFPKKMKDLLRPRIAIQAQLRGHLDEWETKYKKKFEKEFGKDE